MEPKIGANAPDDDKDKRGTESTQREEKAGTQKIQAQGDPHDATIGTTASDDGQVNGVTIAAPCIEMAAPPDSTAAPNGTTASDDGEVNGVTIVAPCMEIAAPPDSTAAPNVKNVDSFEDPANNTNDPMTLKGNVAKNDTIQGPPLENTEHKNGPRLIIKDQGSLTPEEAKHELTAVSSVEQHDDTQEPGALYTSNDKRLRKRTFKYAVCPDAADGSHQCGACFRHVHGCCGEPWPGSEEGYGQVRMCGDCLKQANAAGAEHGAEHGAEPVPEFDLTEEHDVGQELFPDKEAHFCVSQADYEDLRRKGLAYLNLHMDQNGRDGLTPEDYGHSVFTRLQTLEPGPNMDLNEYYALLDIFEGAQKTVQAPPQTNEEGKELYHKGSAGKQKWAENLITALQRNQQEGETLERPRSEDGNVKKPPKKKKKECRGAIGIEHRRGGPTEAHKETEKPKG